MSNPLMPKSTAMWLIDNTALTFEQIADFCGLHPLEIQALADGEIDAGIQGVNPITMGQLTQDEIARCEKDESSRLMLSKAEVSFRSEMRGARYTPLNKRQGKPDAIAWLIKHHPELNDAQIMHLLGTTKKTIDSIRDRSHRNISSIKARDPVILGLCTQHQLNEAVAKAQLLAPKDADHPSDDGLVLTE